MCRDAPTRAIALNFVMVGDITDLIGRPKFYVNQFRGFGVLRPPILPFFIGLAGSPLQFRDQLRYCQSESSRLVITASQFILTTSRYHPAATFMFSAKTLELHYKHFSSGYVSIVNFSRQLSLQLSQR